MASLQSVPAEGCWHLASSNPDYKSIMTSVPRKPHTWGLCCAIPPVMFLILKIYSWAGKEVFTYNLSTSAAEAGRLGVQGQTISRSKTTKWNIPGTYILLSC